MSIDRSRHANPTRRGEAHPDAVMTAERVRIMRRKWRTNMVTQRELAVEFGISQASVNKILNRVTWKQVRDD